MQVRLYDRLQDIDLDDSQLSQEDIAELVERSQKSKVKADIEDKALDAKVRNFSWAGGM